ncbi:uncharacterized protein B0H64DRAFT_240817 [Chaetomium fimeti]|uniref:DUF829-domain-containing protein n=1 Tax=Chaetomium fimeti TaxID=1854472 RepID=A0AAE0H898_9PEZI|nr:hypothetical protein B0H64DRAFT_240817 [Chaetomium fimeti]
MSKAVTESDSSAMLGFKKLSNQVYVQDGPQPSPTNPTNPSDPSTVIIYGWGDARPRHVSKYIAGYRALFPHAQIVLIFSPILKALSQSLEARTQNMVPVLEAVYPSVLAPHASDASKADGRVLLHVMSNAGGINCAATMNAFSERTGGAAVMPHGLMVCDSTPGSTDFGRNVGPWSRALTVGMARWFPWPARVTQGLAAVLLAFLYGAGWVLGATSAGEYSKLAVNDARLSDTSAKRLYLYSKEDEIIRWDDIELHAADARQKGWSVTAEMFEGTSHVGHMRAHAEQYWAAIAAAWKEAVAGADGRNGGPGNGGSKL